MQKNEVVENVVEIAGKTALSVIPVGGTLISCVWDAVKGNAAQKRLDDWKEKVEERLSKVELSIDEIGSNEIFTSTIMRATDIAIKTMEETKREYLANAVLNSVYLEIEESIVMMYLDMIDRYTEWHLKILCYFRNPKAYPGVDESQYYMGSPLHPMYSVFPELEKNSALVNRIIKDLYNDGVLNTENMNCSMTASGMVASRTTDLGNNFIKFITSNE
jgi:hypothetical protein